MYSRSSGKIELLEDREQRQSSVEEFFSYLLLLYIYIYIYIYTEYFMQGSGLLLTEVY